MAHSERQWAIIKAYYERGLSLAEIVARDDVAIKSRGSISKRAKADGWGVSGEKKHLVEDEVKAKRFLSGLIEQKETFAPVERNIHDVLVSERLQDVTLCRNINHTIADLLKKKLRSDGETIEYRDLLAGATAITRVQENLLGKQPDTVINNVNAQTPLPPPAVYAEIAEELFRRV